MQQNKILGKKSISLAFINFSVKEQMVAELKDHLVCPVRIIRKFRCEKCSNSWRIISLKKNAKNMTIYYHISWSSKIGNKVWRSVISHFFFLESFFKNKL